MTPGHGNQADGRRFAGPVGSRVRSGVRWSLLSSVGAAVSQIPQTVVMSRLLTPRDFGLVAVGLVMLRFVSYFAQGGLSSALIQRPSIDRADVRVEPAPPRHSAHAPARREAGSAARSLLCGRLRVQ